MKIYCVEDQNDRYRTKRGHDLVDSIYTRCPMAKLDSWSKSNSRARKCPSGDAQNWAKELVKPIVDNSCTV